MVHESTLLSPAACEHARDPHRHDVALAQQIAPSHFSSSGPYVVRKHEQPSPFGAQPSGWHVHARPAPGHPLGAQQSVRGRAASAQTNEFDGLASEHEQGRPSPNGSGTHRVRVFGSAGAHAPGQLAATQSPRLCASTLETSAKSAVQLSSRAVVHASSFASATSRPALHALST